MASFNVITENWIPVTDKKGNEKEVGILELLEKAHELSEISEASPLMRYGIYRLLVAFLTDALRPKREEDLSNLLQAGRFPLGRIKDYIAECEKEGPCFDLFDERHPFLQSAYEEKWDGNKEPTSVAKLVHELPSGNNALHFNHSPQDIHAFSPAVCAKVLSAVNVFCTSGLQGPSGINGAPPWYLLIKGKSLFESLVFNILLPLNLELEFDYPPVAWRNSQTIEPKKSIAFTSYLYGLTWQSRRICLIPVESNGICTYSGKLCNTLVSKMYFQPGLKFEGHDTWWDPHAAYVFTTKGRSSLKPRESRAIWRDLGPMLFTWEYSARENSFKPPAVVVQYRHMVTNGFWIVPNRIETELYGLVTDKASYISWMHGRFAVDWRAVGNEIKAEMLEEGLRLTEEAAKVIRFSLKQVPPQPQNKKPNQKLLMNELVDQAESQFFNAMRLRFFNEYIPLVAEADSSKPDWRVSLKAAWNKILCIEAHTAFLQGLDSMGGSIKLLKRSAAAERLFYLHINKILDEMKGGMQK